MRTETYVGIDLNEKYAMVSYYTEGMSEPATFSTVTGSEAYQIPVCMAKKTGGHWIYGEEAKRYARESGEVCADNLFARALAGETLQIFDGTFTAEELLFAFLKKIILLPLQMNGKTLPERLVFTTGQMNFKTRALFLKFTEWLKLPREAVLLLDYRESFYYYALSQSIEITRADIALYYYTSGQFLFWQLTHDRHTIPQVCSIEEKSYDSLFKEKDESFAKIAEETLSGKQISAVYLIGDGFDGEWLKQSLNVICRGRRVFMGKNLFCKGACYGAAAKADASRWQYLYMGDNEIKTNVSLRVRSVKGAEFFSLITAGENWYEAGASCEVILAGDSSVDFWLQRPKSSEAVIRTLELTGMPNREDKTTRIRITAKPEAADKIRIRIKDLGFGEIAKSSDMVWEYKMDLEA